MGVILKLSITSCVLQVYETNARIDVELAYTDDFTEHQLQFMAFTRDHEERVMYASRMAAARRYDHASVMHRSVKDLFRDMYEKQEERHNTRMAVTEAEQDELEQKLWQESRHIEELENDLAASKVAMQHHQRAIARLRTIRTEEVMKEQQLLRYMNAVIRIQRWWRYRMWLLEKKGKRRKGKKGKKGKEGQGKSQGKKGGKSRSKKRWEFENNRNLICFASGAVHWSFFTVELSGSSAQRVSIL